MKREYVRKVVVFEDHFKEFRKTLERETLRKLYQVLILIMTIEVVPTKFLKAIEGRKGLFVDEGNLVILFTGFQKKSQKIPVEQLDKAEALMKKYYETKNK